MCAYAHQRRAPGLVQQAADRRQFARAPGDQWLHRQQHFGYNAYEDDLDARERGAPVPAPHPPQRANIAIGVASCACTTLFLLVVGAMCVNLEPLSHSRAFTGSHGLDSRQPEHRQHSVIRRLRLLEHETSPRHGATLESVRLAFPHWLNDDEQADDSGEVGWKNQSSLIDADAAILDLALAMAVLARANEGGGAGGARVV
jgi:hypothetical protein